MTHLAVALSPDGIVGRWMPRLALSVPIGIALIAGALQWTLRGDRWDPAAPEARAVLDDEWRQVSLARAARWALDERSGCSTARLHGAAPAGVEPSEAR